MSTTSRHPLPAFPHNGPVFSGVVFVFSRQFATATASGHLTSSPKKAEIVVQRRRDHYTGRTRPK